MQLIECYIENFGKFSKFRKTFTDGINEIADENGWGKSTLAAFIKVMLYGFDDEKRRVVEKERKKYEPWQGGEYGGRLTIRTEEGTFTICRTFGKTEKTDEFKLLDASTGAETARFGREIGRELLRIDRDTFFNTLYISQADRKAEVTNDIHARIGSQDHILEDISGYEAVEKRMKDELNHASPKRKGGFLCELEKRISEKRQEQEQRAGLEETVETYMEHLAGARRQKAELRKQAEVLQEQRSKVIAYEGLAEKKKRYEALLAENEARQNALADASAAFPQKTPEVVLMELRLYEQKRDMLQKLRMELASLRLTQDDEELLRQGDKIFPDDVFAETFDEQIQKVRRLADISAAFHEKQVTLRAASIARQQAEQERQTKRKGCWQLPAGVLCILAGIGAAVFLNRIAGAAVFLAGLALILWGLCAGKKNAHEKEEQSADTSETALLNAEIEEHGRQKEQLLSELHQFLSALHSDCPDQQIEGKLYELKAEYSTYEKLLEKKRVLLESGKEEQAEQLCRELYECLGQYMPVSIADERQFDGALRQMREDIQRYEHCTREAAETAKRVCDFAEHENVEELAALKEPEDMRTLRELDEQICQVEEQTAECDRRIAQYGRALEERTEALDELDAAAEELKALEERYERVSKKYEALKLAQHYMDEAKTNLTNRYTKPLLDSLKKYYEILSNGEECHYTMDAHMKVSLDIGSIPKELGALSMGYQDLSWLCMRLAFIEAMYCDEKPFLIMDDPLVNMDEKKIQGGKALLTQLASEYQVLYFTCHKSRSISSPINI